MINREYDKIVILCYPAGAGGNFLINCLSLTDQCVLRDARLAEQQLSTGISIQEKLDYFHERLTLSLVNQRWRDLDLGCANLFGINSTMYFLEYPEIIQRKFNYVVGHLIDQEKYLFIVTHSTQYIEAYLKFWPNARVIFLTDYHQFVLNRGYKLQPNNDQLTQYWNIIRGESWPVSPPTTYAEFLILPKSIQDELTTEFHGEIFKWVEVSPTIEELHDHTVAEYIARMGNRAHTWSVDSNFTGDEQKFLTNLNKCAQWVGINVDAPTTALIDYYRHWRDVIFKISKI